MAYLRLSARSVPSQVELESSVSPLTRRPENDAYDKSWHFDAFQVDAVIVGLQDESARGAHLGEARADGDDLFAAVFDACVMAVKMYK